jgi:HK97 gp10 family phage protein
MNRVILNQQAIDELLHSEAGPVARELLRVLVRLEGVAKRLCPVRTGRLRSSIFHRLVIRDGQLIGQVGTSVVYAIFVELGTRYMAAQSFLRAALAEVFR